MEKFLARQPIFNAKQQSIGYELLFRSGPENFFSQTDGDLASATLITNSMMVFDLQTLTGGKKAFINVTRRLLLQDLVSVLPPDSVVLEILETVVLDDEVIEACKRLKKAGYTLALDDYVPQAGQERLWPLIDIVKIDFLATPADQRKKMADFFTLKGVQCLAEKVENQAAVNEALAAKYTMLQGYFFSKPEMVSRREVPAYKLHYLRFLQAVQDPEVSLEDLGRIISQELSLSLKLLRFINSSIFALQRKVDSIQWALRLLGTQTVKRWASMLALSDMGSDKPVEVMITTLVRARFCELMGTALGLGKGADLFLMGMLSSLDLLLGRPLPELLAELPIASTLKEALLDRASVPGQIYALSLAMERGDWKELERLAAALKLDEEPLERSYRESITWADQIFSSTTGG